MAYTYLGNPYADQKTVLDYKNQADQNALAQQTGESANQINQIKIHAAKAEQGAKTLQMVKGHPELWQAARSKAIADGLGDDSVIPAEYDEAWIDQALSRWDETKKTIPAAIQEYEYVNKLDDAQKDLYFKNKRADKVIDQGGYFGRVNPVTNVAEPLPGGIKTPDPKVVDTGGGYGAYNPNNNTIIPAMGGDKGLTPEQQREADAKQRETKDQFNRGLEVKTKALEAVDRLLKNESGVRANRGGISTLIPNVSNSSVDAAADLETLTNLLTTENLGLLKGVLSDTDMRVLASIGSGELAGSDQKALNALKKMRSALSGKIAEAQQYQNTTGTPPLMSELGRRPNLSTRITPNIDDVEQGSIPIPQKRKILKFGEF